MPVPPPDPPGIQCYPGRAKGCGDEGPWLLGYAAIRESPGIAEVSLESCTRETPASSSCSRSLGFLQEGADT